MHGHRALFNATGGQCNDGHWKGIMVLGKNDSPGDTAFLDKWFPFFKIKK